MDCIKIFTTALVLISNSLISEVFFLDLSDSEVKTVLSQYSVEEVNSALSLVYQRENIFSSDADWMYYRELADFIRNRNLKIGVEIGVLYAGNADHILKYSEIESLYAIDPYDSRFFGSKVLSDVMWIKAKKRLASYNARVQLIRNFSVDAAKNFKEGSLDFVFIDGDHTGKAVRSDMQAWYGKIRSGGLVMGDDYHTNFPELMLEVDKFCKMKNASLHNFGHENRIWWFEKP